MNQFDLARIILLLIGHPVSKVRLARLIYFVHKDLIRKKLLAPSSILYIRSPLGPIPDGYTTLALDNDDIITTRNTSTHLSYAAEDYTVSERAIEEESTLLEQYRDMLGVIEGTLKILRPYKTPELVKISHQEPSWLAHHNGEIYEISPQDLKVTFPEQKPLHLKINLIPIIDKSKSELNKAGAMQAHLLRGMIADIVKESTDLEYPDNPATAAPAKPNKQKVAWKIQLPTIHLKISRKKTPKKPPENPTENSTDSDTPANKRQTEAKSSPSSDKDREARKISSSQNKGEAAQDIPPSQNEGENRTNTEQNNYASKGRE